MNKYLINRFGPRAPFKVKNFGPLASACACTAAAQLHYCHHCYNLPIQTNFTLPNRLSTMASAWRNRCYLPVTLEMPCMQRCRTCDGRSSRVLEGDMGPTGEILRLILLWGQSPSKSRIRIPKPRTSISMSPEVVSSLETTAMDNAAIEPTVLYSRRARKSPTLATTSNGGSVNSPGPDFKEKWEPYIGHAAFLTWLKLLKASSTGGACPSGEEIRSRVSLYMVRTLPSMQTDQELLQSVHGKFLRER